MAHTPLCSGSLGFDSLPHAVLHSIRDCLLPRERLEFCLLLPVASTDCKCAFKPSCEEMEQLIPDVGFEASKDLLPRQYVVYEHPLLLSLLLHDDTYASLRKRKLDLETASKYSKGQPAVQMLSAQSMEFAPMEKIRAFQSALYHRSCRLLELLPHWLQHLPVDQHHHLLEVVAQTGQVDLLPLFQDSLAADAELCGQTLSVACEHGQTAVAQALLHRSRDPKVDVHCHGLKVAQLEEAIKSAAMAGHNELVRLILSCIRDIKQRARLKKVAFQAKQEAHLRKEAKLSMVDVLGSTRTAKPPALKSPKSTPKAKMVKARSKQRGSKKIAVVATSSEQHEEEDADVWEVFTTDDVPLDQALQTNASTVGASCDVSAVAKQADLVNKQAQIDLLKDILDQIGHQQRSATPFRFNWGEEYVAMEALRRFVVKYPVILRDYVDAALATLSSPQDQDKQRTTHARQAFQLVNDLSWVLKKRLEPFVADIVQRLVHCICRNDRVFLCEKAQDTLEKLLENCNGPPLVLAWVQAGIDNAGDFKAMNLTSTNLERCLYSMKPDQVVDLAVNSSLVVFLAELLQFRSSTSHNATERCIQLLRRLLGDDRFVVLMQNKVSASSQLLESALVASSGERSPKKRLQVLSSLLSPSKCRANSANNGSNRVAPSAEAT